MEIERELKKKINRGEYRTVSVQITLSSLSTEYLVYSQANKSSKSYQRDKGILEKHLIPEFGRKKLTKIKILQVDRYRAARLSSANPATVNKEVNCLKAMLNKAVEWGYIPGNPLSGFKQLKVHPGRVRYLEPDELNKLLDVCKDRTDLWKVVQIALHTGMRRGEILSLDWNLIDLKRRLIVLEITKNNERRAVPINDTLYEILCDHRNEVKKGKLFPDLNGNMVSMAFRRACKKAGIEDFRFHDLRHTFASHLSMSGSNQRTVQQLLGHKDARMTTRYSHLSEKHLHHAVEVLDRVYKTIEDEEPSGKVQDKCGHKMDTRAA